MKLRPIFSTFTLLTIMLLSYSCSKEDDNSNMKDSPNSSITKDGVLSGKIENYTSETLDDVILRFNDYMSSENGSISTSGNFSIKLKEPDKSELQKITVQFAGSSINNENALISDEGYLLGVKNKISIGGIYCMNDIYYNAYKSGETATGAIDIIYFYSNTAVTVKGTNTDIEFKTGWNEVAHIRTTATSSLLTTKIPSGLKWRYLPGDF